MIRFRREPLAPILGFVLTGLLSFGFFVWWQSTIPDRPPCAGVAEIGPGQCIDVSDGQY